MIGKMQRKSIIMTKKEKEKIIKLLEQVEDFERKYIINLLKSWINIRK